MEHFFGTPKTELVHLREYPNQDAAQRDLFAYIEGDCNRQRIVGTKSAARALITNHWLVMLPYLASDL